MILTADRTHNAQVSQHDHTNGIHRHLGPLAVLQLGGRFDRCAGQRNGYTSAGARPLHPWRADAREPAPQIRKTSSSPGLWACTSTAKTTASNSRCTVTTYPSECVRRKMKPCSSANGIVSSGPHSR